MNAANTIASENLATRLPSELFEKIQKLAEVERRKLSAMTRILLEEALEARGKKRPTKTI
jgi:hypothetical protein